MRVPQKVLNGIAFLGYREEPGVPETEKFCGTGFIVGVDLDGMLFPYLVTAAHVAREMENYADTVARLNDVDGNAYVARVPRKGAYENHDPWYRHPTDSAADVAVRSFFPRPYTKRVNFDDSKSLAYAPQKMLIQHLDLNRSRVGVGDEVFVVGMFHFAQGSDSNTPLVRTGNLAMIPGDKIYTGTTYGLMDAYLVEVQSLGRISGSPVFVRRTVNLPRVGKGFRRLRGYKTVSADYGLLGLIHGHWDIAAENLNGHPPKLPGSGNGANVGIAIVTPAAKIVETLFQPDLVNARQAILDHR